MDLQAVRLVISDMDGSLLNSQHLVPDSFYDLFRKLQARGIHFAAASGRQYDSIVEKLAPIREEITVVAENGALMRRGPKTLLRTPLGRAHVERILQIVDRLPDVHAVVCTADNAFVRAGSPSFIGFMREFYTRHVALQILRKYEGEALKVALYHPTSAETDVYPHVADLAPMLKVKVSGQHWVDVSDPAAHKGTAIAALQHELGISSAETMAFGDYHNDLEMLALADFSYAMGNAHPDIVSAARFQTATNDENGVLLPIQALVKA